MVNRISVYLITGIIILSIFGFVTGILYNPIGILKYLAMIAIIGVIVYFLSARFGQANPRKQHQRAFQKAAKRSKKRFQTKETIGSSKRSTIKSLASARKKKKDASHLTVIEGRKGKKKNRASF